MPRKPRLHYPGALYHVISRGNNRQATYLNDDDYQAFLARLWGVQEKIPFSLYAYCLMPNHFHLLVEVKEKPLSLILQRLLTGYTLYFNRTHRRWGHLFQGRYKAFLCEKDSYLLELTRYIHLNPVRAKLAKNPADWRWSGHREILGRAKGGLATGRVLGMFSSKPGEARKNYARFVRDGMALGHRPDLYPEEKAPYLGEKEFMVEQRVRHEEAVARAAPRKVPRMTLPNLMEEVAKRHRMAGAILQGPSRLGYVAVARREFIRRAYAEGHKPAHIAQAAKRSHSFVARVLQGNKN